MSPKTWKIAHLEALESSQIEVGKTYVPCMENDLYATEFLTQLMCDANLFENLGKEERKNGEKWKQNMNGVGMRTRNGEKFTLGAFKKGWDHVGIEKISTYSRCLPVAERTRTSTWKKKFLPYINSKTPCCIRIAVPTQMLTILSIEKNLDFDLILVKFSEYLNMLQNNKTNTLDQENPKNTLCIIEN